MEMGERDGVELYGVEETMIEQVVDWSWSEGWKGRIIKGCHFSSR